MMAMETSPPAATNPSVLERNKPQPGRCVYCDERCNADATWHHYCRLEYEYEQHQSLGKIRLKSRQQSPIETE